MVKMHTRICFKKLRFSYGKPFLNLEVIASFRLGPIVLPTSAITLSKNKRSIATWNMKVGSILLGRDYNYEEEEIKLMYKAVYQLNDIEKH
jgi:hypothetical protein